MAETQNSFDSDPVVVQMCEELGIDPFYEKPLVWVVSIGLQSPLPPRWTIHQTEPEHQTYYVDGDTHRKGLVHTYKRSIGPSSCISIYTSTSK